MRYQIMSVVKKCSLWFREGTSDKVYVATLTLSGTLYTLTGEWGRRGKSMKSQVKGHYHHQWQATRAFHELVASKTLKGYREVSQIPV